MRQDTVNHDIDNFKGTCGCAYFSWISDVATSNGDMCKLGIFLLRSDLTHNHGVEILFSSVLRGIFESNDAESFHALHTLVPGAL